MNNIDVAKQWRTLEQTYNQMSEEELGDLAAEAYKLTDIAQQALQAQISSRALRIELSTKPRASRESNGVEPEVNLNPYDLDYVLAAWVRDPQDLEQLRQALPRAGIPIYVQVRVRAVDQQRALHTISALSPERGNPDEDQPYVARCPKCGSEEIAFQNIDPGSSETQSTSSSQFHWACDACGHEWEDDGFEERSAS